MATNYPKITASKKISNDFDTINETFEMVGQDVDRLDNRDAQLQSSINQTDKRLDTIIGGSSPTKDPELTDIRTPDPSYTPERPINVAGDMMRDMQKQFNEQLADIANELATKAPQSALDATNAIVATKAPQSELDAANAQISLRPTYDEVNELLSRLGNMSPKGGFPTLAALEATYPNGAEGLYLVAADNHWYYWNGSAWTDGGLYQAMPWAEFMTTQDEPWEV